MQDYWRQLSANSSTVACRTANPTSFLRPVVASASLFSATAIFWRLEKLAMYPYSQSPFISHPPEEQVSLPCCTVTFEYVGSPLVRSRTYGFKCGQMTLEQLIRGLATRASDFTDLTLLSQCSRQRDAGARPDGQCTTLQAHRQSRTYQGSFMDTLDDSLAV